MFELRCTVRNCDSILQLNDAGLTCARGHHFDRAKQGYWNLLQPQDRKSKNPGDCEDAVLARHRWLQRGHAKGLIERLKLWIEPSGEARVLDLGCGEGTFGPALFGHFPGGYCGVDLSSKAIKLASRSWPEATWVLANADRTLPVTNGSIDRVLSLFGRRPATEIGRVLSQSGECIVAVPGEEDLIELREQVQQSGVRRSRWEVICDELNEVGLECVEHSLWLEKVELQPDAIADALSMTYRAVRHSQRARLESVETTSVTLAADLMRLRRKRDTTAVVDKPRKNPWARD